ncbi:MAG: Lrp/AsnC ligand binding domain-containing protein [Armatimonadota bacterium]|nr:Lrp/AsnC ligand binding domain-containing protein [Armatimonadota bacterium]MDR7427104.1 Lrp/AsnC ligand binding domain-containing protein [Armatimonadota bacterium]MDR7464652.1 Lrp/AsnC ligand binding domain-containing protein [Armatimonadota bacterium]MDR7470026.1 Lrp/AsnC ligand binding domain-containing protein [Armatimonadota bacterium]MDR7474128.1 Lrp/AsnC ligand binding domain-containing protein [Armatimonadota bacterium]
MLETAYFLITLGHRTPAEVARAVRRVPGITEAVVTMGEVDIIAIAQMEGTRGFPALTEALKKIDGVASVTACVVVRP